MLRGGGRRARSTEPRSTDEIRASVGLCERDHHERKDERMKLTTMTQVTVDGVMQGNGGASDEDRRNGFERGGWALGAGDDETMTLINQTYQRADAFLFGRRTYELFAGYWGAEERARAAAEDPGNHPIAAALNTKPKYLASTTLSDPQWADTTLLSGDLAAAIGELKARPGGELQVHGSGTLIQMAARERPRRRDHPARRSRGPRPGHAAVPRRRPGPCARPGRLANRLEGRDDPGLPAQRAPAVRGLKYVTQQLRNRLGTMVAWRLFSEPWRTRAGGRCSRP